MKEPKDMTKTQLISRVDELSEQLKHAENILMAMFSETPENEEDVESRAIQYLLEYRPQSFEKIREELAAKERQEEQAILEMHGLLDEPYDVAVGDGQYPYSMDGDDYPCKPESPYGDDAVIVAELTLSGEKFTVGYTHNANPADDSVFIRNHQLFEPDYMGLSETMLLIQALHVARDGARGIR